MSWYGIDVKYCLQKRMSFCVARTWSLVSLSNWFRTVWGLSGQALGPCQSYGMTHTIWALNFSDFDIPINIASTFVSTLVNLPPVMSSPKGDPQTVTLTTTVPEVPSDVTCNYDVVVAIDLECIDNEENSGRFSNWCLSARFLIGRFESSLNLIG